MGALVLLISVVGFVVWALNMPLSSASIAPGSVVVESKRKQIQHLQGGWVKDVFVKEGQSVEAGQVLMELADSKAESDYRRYLFRSYSLIAQQTRLVALVNQQKKLDWSQLLKKYASDSFVIRPLFDSEDVQFQQALLKHQLLSSQYQQQVFFV